MNYRVEELAQAAGVRVDTLRFYQGRGLLPPPRREGRIAVYAEAHLERLRRIRELQEQGLRLNQIRKLLERDSIETPEPLLTALVEEHVGGARTLTREELAAEAGIPKILIQAAVRSGLFAPLQIDGEERFSQADAEMARAGLALLESGFPLHALLGQAVGHARHVNDLCDQAIEMFDEHVRKQGPGAGDMEAITESFRRLLPLVTRLVALHFQRTLVSRALNRLEGKEELEALEAALAATESARLDVEVAWR
jgi:DNA-binding transcriptional MerR regulator